MPPKKGPANGLSEYELERQAKIAQNQALLKTLQLEAASAGLAPKLSRKQGASTGNRASNKKKPAPKVKKEEDLQPRRQSSRIRGIQADSEVAKRKAEEEHETLRAAEQAKRQRVSDDLKLGDMLVNGSSNRFWDSKGNWLTNVGPAMPYEKTYDEAEAVKRAGTKEIKELRERFSTLELWEGIEPNRIKIVPERVYAMGFHPSEEKAIVFAGDKMGNLGILDGSQKVNVKVEEGDEDELDEEEIEPAITTFKPHTRTISSIHFTPSQPQSVYTSSYDSSIRKLDLAKGVSTEVYAPNTSDIDDPLSGISIPSTSPNMLYFASLNGSFGMHDSRTNHSTSPPDLMQLSDKKIGGFSIHPRYPHFVATASLDRTVKLWDLRKISGRKDSRMPALVAEHESKLSVSHAAFNAAGQIATSSYDDTIKIHEISASEASSWPSGKAMAEGAFDPKSVIAHNNQTGRWVTILRPHWQANPTNIGNGLQRFCIGNMNRFVDIYAGDGQQLGQLGSEFVTAVPAVAVFHPSQDWVAGGTASGKLCLWV